MPNRLIYLVGQPGAGKSTLMRLLTAGYTRLPYDPPEVPVAHDVLLDSVTGEIAGAEIGKRRELFSGTDALPSSVIEKAIPWIETLPYRRVLGEGARLSNLRFLRAAADAGYAVTVALLDHPDAESWRKLQARQIGREQNISLVKSRLAAARNLAEQLTDTAGVTVLRGHPDDLYPQLTEVLCPPVQPRQ
jgi:GTPase SAR1 family protein